MELVKTRMQAKDCGTLKPMDTIRSDFVIVRTEDVVTKADVEREVPWV